MSKTYHIKTSKKIPEMSPVELKTVSVQLSIDQLKQMRRYADLPISATASEIVKEFIKYGTKLPFKHNRDGRL
jgi:hypothetical protein